MKKMHDFIRELFPICRSITGNGVRQTLRRIQEDLPNLQIHEVSSGTQVFDWRIPDEWNVTEAWVKAPNGKKVIDFSEHNLHLVGYSEPVDATMSLDELQTHLYSLPEQPEAIPYVTSYYKRRWGFCLKHSVREQLSQGEYQVHIDSTLQSGSLTYGELVIPGELESEVLLSTYVCHPSMANNELSGPAVATALAQWAMERPRKYTYRFVFIPETIGSITYCSMNLEKLKSHVVAGFNLTCMGDERTFSYLPTRKGNTWVDRVALHVLSHFAPGFKRYTFLDRGSDERQYNAPGVDLPVCSVMRSKYGDYPEYHTSLDDLSLVTEAGLQSSFEMLKKCLTALELDRVLVNNVLCEPQMGRHNLYPTLSTKENRSTEVKDMMNMLAYIDGEASLLDIAETIGHDIFTCANLAGKLLAAGLCNND